ncbi:hypothetical protein [Nesterenkonia natronophila]|uniref:Uncharacterized protein n=1 Tax=Nesterenkonia natronophila TaxID=2174932 RepID=A0A3A4F3I6_9MICC|nr:hypothetical protein [Nesterenkonia natronophila]RJN32902.1 hypothetical protein D3250_03560 [Nesterenkonia natronophila]
MPEAAEEREDTEGIWDVPDANYEEVVSWYEEQLPVGDDYEDLEFCETQETETSTHWLWWEEAPEGHDGTPWLSVVVFEEDSVDILITYNDEDPSACY